MTSKSPMVAAVFVFSAAILVIAYRAILIMYGIAE